MPEKTILQTAVPKYLGKRNINLALISAYTAFGGLAFGNPDKQMEILNLLPVLLIHGYGADVGQGHGMRPVVAPEDKSKGQPFDKQGQDAHIPFLFIGHIIGYGLFQLFLDNIVIHLAADRGQDGIKGAVTLLPVIINGCHRKEIRRCI